MTPEQQLQLDDLILWKKNMENSKTVPLSVDQAFRGRFLFSSIVASAKSATSENQSVNEAGAATYSVLGPPTAFIQIVINNTTYYIPVYT